MDRVTRELDRVLIWVAALSTLIGGLSWVAKKLTVFGPIGWPEAVFIGIGAASVAQATLAAGLFAWRYFKPIEAATLPVEVALPVPAVEVHPPPGPSLDQISVLIANEIEGKIDQTRRAVIGRSALDYLPELLAKAEAAIGEMRQHWERYEKHIRALPDLTSFSNQQAARRLDQQLWIPYNGIVQELRVKNVHLEEAQLAPDEIPVPLQGDVKDPAVYNNLRNNQISFVKRMRALEIVRRRLQEGVSACRLASERPGEKWPELLRGKVVN